MSITLLSRRRIEANRNPARHGLSVGLERRFGLDYYDARFFWGVLTPVVGRMGSSLWFMRHFRNLDWR